MRGGMAINHSIAGEDDRDSEDNGAELILETVRDVTLDLFRKAAKTGQVAFRGAQEVSYQRLGRTRQTREAIPVRRHLTRLGGLQVTKAVGLLMLGSVMSSTGFVTFKTLTASTVASQAQLTAQPLVFDTCPAPEPRDVVWHNVAVPLSQIDYRVNVTSLFFMICVIFWGVVTSGIYNVQNYLQTVQETHFYLNLGEWGRFLVQLLIDYAPTLLLLIVMSLLPLVFSLASYRYERLKTHSDVQASIMSRYFYYQMMNIYITIIGGTVLKTLVVQEIQIIIDNPRAIFEILGCQVPVVAVYFIQLIVTKTFSACLWEFARVWPLLQMWYMQRCTNHRHKTARERRTGVYAPPVFQYGWTYPSLLLVFTLCLTYDVIMPVTLLFGALFFQFAEIMYTYHLVRHVNLSV
jgi:hypothetical protein